MSTMDSYGTDDDDHIKISEVEGSEFMEFPKEEDDSVLLSTLQAQFPNAIGLKYRGSSGAWRALRAVENVLAAPKGGWGDRIYCLTVNETNKRKTEHAADGERKKPRINTLLQDMAVMNLPFQTTEAELREYFEKNFGDLDYVVVKTFRDTGKSKGYGFVRFKDELAAKEAVSAEHHMHGRRVELKQNKEKPMKLFVGRLPDGTTQEELKEYFSTFGDLTDVYIPTPFRNFGFVTYASTEEGKSVLRDTHALHGNRLNVMERNPDTRQGNRDDKGDRGDRGDRRDRDRSDRGDRGDRRERSDRDDRGSRSDRGDRGGRGDRDRSQYDKYNGSQSSNYTYDKSTTKQPEGSNYTYDKNSSSLGLTNYTYDKFSSSQTNSNPSYDNYGTSQTITNPSYDNYGTGQTSSNPSYGSSQVAPTPQQMSSMDPDLKNMLLQYLAGK